MTGGKWTLLGFSFGFHCERATWHKMNGTSLTLNFTKCLPDSLPRLSGFKITYLLSVWQVFWAAGFLIESLRKNIRLFCIFLEETQLIISSSIIILFCIFTLLTFSFLFYIWYNDSHGPSIEFLHPRITIIDYVWGAQALAIILRFKLTKSQCHNLVYCLISWYWLQ